jgi:hypothetical protein
MLLSESDREFYFPSVPLTGAALTGAIWRAQSTAETIAARSLDVTLYEETVTFSHSGQVQLKYVPIVTSKELIITLSITGHVVTSYDLDPDEGILTIHSLIRPSVATVRHRRPIGFDSSSSHGAIKAKVVYHAGFNPDDNDPRARAAKVAVASILNYQVLVN